MRPSTRTLLQMLAIVAAAALLAFLFNRWRPTPLAWVRTEAFVPAPAPSAAPKVTPSPAPDAPAVPTPEPQAPPSAAPTSEAAPGTEPPVPTAPTTDASPAAETPAAPPGNGAATPEAVDTPTAPAAPAMESAPSPARASAPEPSSPTDASLADALQLHLSGHGLFLDARDPDTYAQGHIPGALCVPPTDLDRLWPQLAPLLEGKTIITYCDGAACRLSHELAEALRLRGVTTVLVLGNGWSLWQDEHLPVTTGPNP